VEEIASLTWADGLFRDDFNLHVYQVSVRIIRQRKTENNFTSALAGHTAQMMVESLHCVSVQKFSLNQAVCVAEGGGAWGIDTFY
jgi:hypothetical protein